MLRLDEARRHDVGKHECRPPPRYRGVQAVHVGEPAANHNHLGVEQVDHAGQRAREPVFIALEA
jgi:hypothetical protein